MIRKIKWFFIGSLIFMLLGTPAKFGMSKVDTNKEDPGQKWLSEKAILIVSEADRWENETGCIENSQRQLLSITRVAMKGKVSGLLLYQIELRKKQIANPRADRLERIKASGMRVNNMSIQRIFVYFIEKPTAGQVEELQDMGIHVDVDSWIPPVGNHSAGFLVADMPIDKLDELANKSYVVRLDTAERVEQPLTMPGYEESIPLNK